MSMVYYFIHVTLLVHTQRVVQAVAGEEEAATNNIFSIDIITFCTVNIIHALMSV